MKKINRIFLVGLVSLLTITSCSLEEVGDLNGPSRDTILNSSTRGDIQDLIGGVLNNMRIRLGAYYDDTGVIGREFYRFSSSDPRFVRELLGENNAKLDNSSFLITGPWAARYSTVKSINILLDAIKTTTPAFSKEEVSSITGFAKTIQAYELLLNLNLTYQNGIRLDVKDPKNLGPIVGYDAALAAISKMLDEAAEDLANAGDSFPFSFGASGTSGFEDFKTPDSFRQFNRAIAARVAVYSGDDAKANAALSESFLDLSSVNLNLGVYYKFSTNGADILNPVYFPQNATESGARIVHPSFIKDAIINVVDNDTIFDPRFIEKTSYREILDKEKNKIVPNPLIVSGLGTAYDFFVYKTNVADIPIITNEELILLYAEANIGTPQADNAINILRNYYGLTPKNSVTLDDVLHEKRFSLYGQGHRWIDMRRYDKLDELPIDREGDPNAEPPIGPDDVWVQFPIPLTENQ